jgi:hypothetical protein
MTGRDDVVVIGAAPLVYDKIAGCMLARTRHLSQLEQNNIGRS